MDVTREQLQELYVNQGLSVRECAKILHMSTHGGVLWRLKKYGIKARPSRFQKNNRKPGDRSPESHGSWKGGKQTVSCNTCGREIKRFPSCIHDKNFCDDACYGKWRSENFMGERNPNFGNVAMFGNANPNWKGGISIETYCDAWKDRDFKKDIKARDNHECQSPDCRKNSKSLTVHHIDYEKKNCHPRNLITLCNSCNARANFNRDFWQSGYEAIIRRKYQLEQIEPCSTGTND